MVLSTLIYWLIVLVVVVVIIIVLFKLLGLALLLGGIGVGYADIEEMVTHFNLPLQPLLNSMR